MLDILSLHILGSISSGFLFLMPEAPDLVKKEQEALISIKYVVILIVLSFVRF